MTFHDHSFCRAAHFPGSSSHCSSPCLYRPKGKNSFSVLLFLGASTSLLSSFNSPHPHEKNSFCKLPQHLTSSMIQRNQQFPPEAVRATSTNDFLLVSGWSSSSSSQDTHSPARSRPCLPLQPHCAVCLLLCIWYLTLTQFLKCSFPPLSFWMCLYVFLEILSSLSFFPCRVNSTCPQLKCCFLPKISINR